MNRRDMLGMLMGVAATPLAAPARAQSAWQSSASGDAHPFAVLEPSWAAWKATYLNAEGRVVDDYQEGASHSESQGYGLYLAVRFNDMETFRLIYSWTENNLAIRPDGLLAWRWKEQSSPHVEDTNNASDGDLFYAWALMKGADQFDLPEARDRAQQIAKALEKLCHDTEIRTENQVIGQETLLLPGAEGFVRSTQVIYNPSYWMPRLMTELAQTFSCPKLYTAVYAGLNRLGTIAASGLAPDWTAFQAEGWTLPPAGFSSNAGYEAMRVPLYLCMSGMQSHPMVSRFREVYRTAMSGDDPMAPTVMTTQGEIIERSPHPGYAAIAGLTNCAISPADGPLIPLFSVDQPYYPATLHLFVLIAQIEGYPACIPI